MEGGFHRNRGGFLTSSLNCSLSFPAGLGAGGSTCDSPRGEPTPPTPGRQLAVSFPPRSGPGRAAVLMTPQAGDTTAIQLPVAQGQAVTGQGTWPFARHREGPLAQPSEPGTPT